MLNVESWSLHSKSMFDIGSYTLNIDNIDILNVGSRTLNARDKMLNIENEIINIDNERFEWSIRC